MLLVHLRLHIGSFQKRCSRRAPRSAQKSQFRSTKKLVPQTIACDINERTPIRTHRFTTTGSPDLKGSGAGWTRQCERDWRERCFRLPES